MTAAQSGRSGHVSSANVGSPFQELFADSFTAKKQVSGQDYLISLAKENQSCVVAIY